MSKIFKKEGKLPKNKIRKEGWDDAEVDLKIRANLAQRIFNIPDTLHLEGDLLQYIRCPYYTLHTKKEYSDTSTFLYLGDGDEDGKPRIVCNHTHCQGPLMALQNNWCSQVQHAEFQASNPEYKPNGKIKRKGKLDSFAEKSSQFVQQTGKKVYVKSLSTLELPPSEYTKVIKLALDTHKLPEDFQVKPMFEKRADMRSYQIEQFFGKDTLAWCGEYRKDPEHKNGGYFVGDFTMSHMLINTEIGLNNELITQNPHKDRGSRCNANLLERRTVVLESDEISLEEALDHIVGWIKLGLRPKTVVFSGNKSLHLGFCVHNLCKLFGGEYQEGQDLYKLLGAQVKYLGYDPSTLRVAQPIRQAGGLNKKTNKVQYLVDISKIV